MVLSRENWIDFLPEGSEGKSFQSLTAGLLAGSKTATDRDLVLMGN